MGVHETSIENSLKELRMDGIDFAKISGVNRTILSSAFRGRHNFSNPEILRLTGLLRELKDLALDAEPFSLSFKDWKRVQKLLEMRRMGLRIFTQFAAIQANQ